MYNLVRRLKDILQVVVRHPGDPGNPKTNKETGHFNRVEFKLHR